MGNKYDPDYTGLAEWVYSRANCVILCAVCNISIGGGTSKRDELLRYNMGLYGPDEVLATLRAIAKLSSKDRIPSVIEFEGKEYRIWS